MYTKPYFIINGTLENWKSEFDKLVIYSNGNEEDEKNLNRLVNEFSQFSDESKQSIIDDICVEYLSDYKDNYNENKVIELFYIKCLDKRYLDAIEDIDKLIISILTGKFELDFDPLILVGLLETMEDETWF